MTKVYALVVCLQALSATGISRPFAGSDSDIVAKKATVTTENYSFKKGVLLDADKTAIPWGVSFDDLVKSGKPVISCMKGNGTRVTWYDLTMFNDIHVKKMWCEFSKCYKKTPIKQRLNTLYFSIDTADIAKLKTWLESFPNQSMELAAAGKSNYHYTCTIDDCKIFLGYEKFYNGFVWMQSRDFYR